jgi:hypothetical protein
VEGIRDNHGGFEGMGGEEQGISSRHRAIRALLLALPQLEAPLGLESRLWSRITGIQSRRKGLNWDLWILTRRWLPVGFGIATAVVIGLIFFDSQQTNIPVVTQSEFAVKNTPSSPVALPEALPVSEDTEPEFSRTGSPEREVSFDMAASRQDDSSRHGGFSPPSGHFQSVESGRVIRGR